MRRRRGANAIEFALTLPVFITVMFASVEYGWYFFEKAVVVEATRMGCRTGSVRHPDDPTEPAHEVAHDMMLERLRGEWPTCTGGGDCAIGVEYVRDAGTELLVCEARVVHEPLTGLLPTIPSELASRTVLMLEQQR